MSTDRTNRITFIVSTEKVDDPPITHQTGSRSTQSIYIPSVHRDPLDDEEPHGVNLPFVRKVQDTIAAKSRGSTTTEHTLRPSRRSNDLTRTSRMVGELAGRTRQEAFNNVEREIRTIAGSAEFTGATSKAASGSGERGTRRRSLGR